MAAGEVDLSDLDPGGDVGVGPDAVRPEPTSAPGDRAAGWEKVGSGYEGGRQFGYCDMDGPGPWKQT